MKYLVFFLMITTLFFSIPLCTKLLLIGLLLCINGIFFIKGLVRILAFLLGLIALFGAYCAFKGDPTYIY